MSHQGKGMDRRSVLASAAGLAAASMFAGKDAAAASYSLLNVSYDPTRELYKEINAAFAPVQTPTP